jgi:hypothetical protein
MHYILCVLSLRHVYVWVTGFSCCCSFHVLLTRFCRHFLRQEFFYHTTLASCGLVLALRPSWRPPPVSQVCCYLRNLGLWAPCCLLSFRRCPIDGLHFARHRGVPAGRRIRAVQVVSASISDCLHSDDSSVTCRSARLGYLNIPSVNDKFDNVIAFCSICGYAVL